MSFSMLEPEETPVCECRYDEARDMMDREDCPFHRDLVEQSSTEEAADVRTSAARRNHQINPDACNASNRFQGRAPKITGNRRLLPKAMRDADCTLTSAWRARVTFPRMLLAHAVQ